MKVLKFNLKGKNAFFKKPDVNTFLYFTYGNIHKVALMGMFGAILGYKGYNSTKLKYILDSNKKAKENDFTEFYSKLKDIKVAIKPNNEKGFIPKKMQIFNNSVGYASKEQGGNLIVKEQWLENPSWDIYVLLDDEEASTISEHILNNKAVYIPYLGKNDHYADIEDAKILDAVEIEDGIEPKNIDCLYPKRYFKIDMDDELEEDDDGYVENAFKYEEALPIALDKDNNMYIFEDFVYTNMNLLRNGSISVYKVEGNNIVFY